VLDSKATSTTLTHVLIYVAGINGMVGSALALEAKLQGYETIGKSSKELNFKSKPLPVVTLVAFASGIRFVEGLLEPTT